MEEQEIVRTEEEVVEETTPEAEPESEEEIDWKARAMKAEALIVKNKKAPVAEKSTQAAPITDPIEAALRVTGMSKELIAQLKKVAAVTGKDLVDAQSDPLFVALKENLEKEQKRENASLPASRGAGTVKPKVSFSTPGLTREQHMELIRSRS